MSASPDNKILNSYENMPTCFYKNVSHIDAITIMREDEVHHKNSNISPPKISTIDGKYRAFL